MQPLHPAPSISSPKEDSLELAEFRKAWKEEVQRKKGVNTTSTSKFLDHELVVLTSIEADTSQHREYTQSAQGPTQQQQRAVPRLIVRSRKLEEALDVYHKAVRHEQSGEFDVAIGLYRQAFRMEPHVDRAYQNEEMMVNAFGTKAPVPSTQATTELIAVEDSMRSMQLNGGQPMTTGLLAQLVASFPQDVSFQPEDEMQPVYIATLPDELLSLILRKLDHTSIERFAAVCRKARLVSLDATIWKELVMMIYKPPQIPSLDDLPETIDRCLYDYRRIYIEQPRVRIDGVYIAVCHYLRPGLSENSWVNVSHLITYHRYLRFYPNGQVLSLLANGEHHPQHIIPLLKPTLRGKGLMIGEWSLAGNTIYLTNLMDADSTSSITSLPALNSHFISNVPRYIFRMTLALRSKPAGRWNRLSILGYDTVSLETGDATPVALKSERPFWFSKVRSYAYGL